MAATPIVPTSNIKSLTVGSANTPGQITLINGAIVMVDGADLNSYNSKFDGRTWLVNDGTNDRLLMGYGAGLF